MIERAPSASKLGAVARRLGAALRLFSVDRLGHGAVVLGRPFVSNAGQIRIGSEFFFSSRPSVSHLVTMKGASIEIGDRVNIACGASISASASIRIGNGVRIGPSVMIMDSDFHVVGDRNARPLPQPVRIGNDVVIGHRVTILRGSTVGDGARIESGSVVAGDVPAGEVVAGVPATSAAASGAAGTDSIAFAPLVQRVLGLASVPEPSDGPDTLPQWDSLGALKLLLAIEQSYGVSLRDAELKASRSVAELAEIVAAARSRKERG